MMWTEHENAKYLAIPSANMQNLLHTLVRFNYNAVVIPLVILLLCHISYGANCKYDSTKASVFSKVRIYCPNTEQCDSLMLYALDTEHSELDSGSIITIIHTSLLSKLTTLGYRIDIEIPDMEKWYEVRLKRSSQPQPISDNSQDNDSYSNRLKVLHGIQPTPDILSLDIPPSFTLGSMSGYYTLAEIYSNFDRMMESTSISVTKVAIGRSIEKRDIYAYVLRSKKATTNLPKVLYTSLTHAREPLSVMSLCYYAWWLIDNYDTNELATAILDNRELWFIPCVNPDGVLINQTKFPSGGGLWRKNARSIDGKVIGVDINRNYGPYQEWNSPLGGSSDDKETDIYRGEGPFSEPETQAVRDVVYLNDIRTIMNGHSFGTMYIYPVNSQKDETSDSTLFRYLGSSLTNQNRYYTGRATQTVGYSVRGEADSWAFLYHTQIRNQRSISVTSEVGLPSDGFWAVKDRIIPICHENISSNITLALSAGSYIKPIHIAQNYSTLNSISTIELANIGIETSKATSVQLRPLDSRVQCNQSLFPIASLTPSSSIKIEFECTTSLPQGTRTPVEILIQQFGITTRDTFIFQTGQPIISSLYNNTSLLSDWVSVSNTNQWINVLDAQTQKELLVDNINNEYKSNTASTLTYQNIISLKNATSASLLIDMNWSIDPLGDCLLVQVKPADSSGWISLSSQRTRTSLGDGNSRQPQGQEFLAGHYPLFNQQVFSLDKLCGKDIQIRLNFLSNSFVNLNGIKISDINLVQFQSLSNMQSETPANIGVSIYPNPANSILNINTSFDVKSVTIYDVLGTKRAVLNPLGSTTFNIEYLPIGNYTLGIETNDLSISHYPLQIVR